MVATFRRHDTTAVLLPDVSAPELAALVQQMTLDAPEAAARIQRATSLLLSGALHDTATLGVYSVNGCEGRT